MIKIIPHVDCTPRICELVALLHRGRDPEGRLDRAGGAAARPARPVPVAEPAGAARSFGEHTIADLTLGLGEVVYDYLQRAQREQHCTRHTQER